jgi:flagellar export protein FliJ
VVARLAALEKRRRLRELGVAQAAVSALREELEAARARAERARQSATPAPGAALAAAEIAAARRSAGALEQRATRLVPQLDGARRREALAVERVTAARARARAIERAMQRRAARDAQRERRAEQKRIDEVVRGLHALDPGTDHAA